MRNALLSLAASGCGYSSYYPNYPEWLVETGLTGTDPQEIVPCSAPYGSPLALTFVSTTDAALQLGSVTADTCTELPYGPLAGGQSLQISTTDNIVWTVRDSAGMLLSVVQAPPGAGSFAVSVP